MRKPSARPLQLLLQLQSAKQVIVYREHDLRLTQAKAQSFVCEYNLLQRMPVAERPADYAAVMAHVETNLIYFRDRLELYQERYILSLQELHKLLIAIVRQFPDDRHIYAQCEKVIQLSIPTVDPPGDAVQTQQQAISWLSQVEERIGQEETDLQLGIERLRKLLELKLG